jgi:predicted O-linked N-acetylglucosamine transferase (SPINDLY family)
VSPARRSSFKRGTAEQETARAQNDHGKALLRRGNVAAAIDSFERTLTLQPDSARANNNLGCALLERGDLVDAEACYRRALALEPGFAFAHNNLGNIRRLQGDFDDAVRCCERALALAPDLAEAHLNRGAALQEQGSLAEAVACYERALALKPGLAQAHHNLGVASHQRGEHGEAEASFRRALKLERRFAEPWKNLGNTLWERGRIGEAIRALRQALALKPSDPEAIAQLAHLNRHACDWRRADEESERVLDAVRRKPRTISPFVLLSLASTPADQLASARQWAGRLAIGRSRQFVHERPTDRNRVHVGYLSPDLRDHAVAYAILETIENHDRKAFRVSAFSSGPDDRSSWRRRLESAFDAFTDLRDYSDEEAARRIRTDGIDILIDLAGYTGRARTRILAFRPAPIQVNFLGYLGTMGAEFIDYVIADPFIAPSDRQQFYSERLVHLSRGWWPAGARLDVAGKPPSRAECGLPSRGFVFCCFNAPYKLGPIFFDVWMRLLSSVPGSVLWLAETNSLVRQNLRREAARRRIEPDRLVFASYQPMAKHLARHRLADLFLDTLPYNACGTACDALRAGLPLLTCAGETFAGRVAGTMLRAAGLPELVTTSLEDYEALALRLATEPNLIRGIREKLTRTRLTMPLFDSRGFTRELEAAYLRMWEIWRSGGTPRPFAVGVDDRYDIAPVKSSRGRGSTGRSVR